MTYPFASLTLEDVLTGSGFADLDASPLQRAICRAAYGFPLDGIIDTDTLTRCFGTDELPSTPALLVALICGVRGGKSFIAACALIHAALTANLERLKPYEVARGVIIGPTVDAASATFTQLAGIIDASPVLRAMVAERSADSITLRRPDGRSVELTVVAAHRGGLSVRNRWLVCLILEEAAQFGQEASGASVNVEELLRAGVTRLVPGGRAWVVTSPFGPVGLPYDLWKKHFGRPGRNLVVWASTRDLNPTYPQEAIDALEAEDPDTAAREHYARWVDADSTYLGAVLIDPAVRAKPLIRTGIATAAGGDFATRSNGWTLACAWTEGKSAEAKNGKVIVAGAWEWRGSKTSPLSPKAVFAEMAAILKPYKVRAIHVDGWSFDAMQDHARDVGLRLIEQPGSDRDLPYQRLKARLGNGEVELPPNPTMRADLLSIRQRATAGSLKIILPRTPDGRHADFAPSVALAVAHAERASRSSVRYTGIASAGGTWGEHEGVFASRDRGQGLDYSLPPDERWKKFFNQG